MSIRSSRRKSAIRALIIICLPSFASLWIAHLTIAIPRMILAETALSLLGLGLRSPALNCDVLLQQAQNFRRVTTCPWLLIPDAFVIVTAIEYNFVGGGWRDAGDPCNQ